MRAFVAAVAQRALGSARVVRRRATPEGRRAPAAGGRGVLAPVALAALGLLLFLAPLSGFGIVPRVAAQAGAAWRLLTANGAPGSPPLRVGHAAAWDSQANRLLVFGGGQYTGTLRNDLWAWSAAGGWQQLTPAGAPGSPSQRQSPAAAWDSQGSRLLVFGGRGDWGYYYNDLWAWSASGGWQQLTANGAPGSPAARLAHAAAWDSQQNRLLVFGGRDASNHFYNDLWAWSTAGGWQQLAADGAPSSPGQRYLATAVWDSQVNRLLVFGGRGWCDPFVNCNDLWAWSASGGWQVLTTLGAGGSPTERNGHAAAWDRQQNRLLVFGGTILFSEREAWNDLWAWSASGGWQQITANGAPGSPGERYLTAAAWDSQQNRLLVYGGRGYGYYNDLWAYGVENSAPTVSANSATVVVDEGQTAANSGSYSDADAGDNVTLSASVGTITKTGTNSGTWNWSFTTADGPAQSQTVTIAASDGRGGTASTTFQLTVNNVAPTATFDAPASVNEGSPIVMSLTAPVEPSPADVAAGLTYAFDCGAGYGAYGAASGASCPTTDNGTRTVKGKVRDKDGGESAYSANVTITNVAPTVSAGADAVLYSGQSLSVSAGFTDPGVNDAPWTYTIDWNDGPASSGSTSTQGAGVITGAHQYFVPGTYTVKVCVTDKDNGKGCDDLTVEVKRLVVRIDIKPGSDPNSINLRSRGNVPVGILGGTYSGVALDATTIVRSTVVFAGAAALGIGGSPQDVNGDGRLDVVYHFDTQAVEPDEWLDAGVSDGADERQRVLRGLRQRAHRPGAVGTSADTSPTVAREPRGRPRR